MQTETTEPTRWSAPMHSGETALLERALDLGDDRRFVCTRTLGAGDAILLASGGHGFTVLEEVEMFEVKQGPFAGDDDKVRFEHPGCDDAGA